jgi:hypothetical protein
MGTAFLVVSGFVLYFFPTLIGRKKRNAGAIFVLNLLLGWTLIGWIIALVWAFTVDPPNPSAAVQPNEATCGACGARISRVDRFCTHCGGEIDRS